MSRDLANPARTSISAMELIMKARELSGLLADNAFEAEQRRQPTDEVIDALVESRVFDLMAPRTFGGLEFDLDTFFEVGLALGEGDASMAWVANFYIEHVWILCQFPESFQRQLFSGRSHVLAPSMLSPSGKVTREPGGWRLNGRWSWSTGIMHAEWVIPAAIMKREDGKRAPYFFALPVEDVRVEDVWFVDGMQGTGSNDVIIDDAFVPEERCVSYADMIGGDAPGAEIHGGPLYRTPMLPILGLAAALPALGQAKTSVRIFEDKLRERFENPTPTRQARPAAFMRLAQADLDVQQAELLLRHMVDDVMALRNQATARDRARWAAQLARAVDQSKRAILSVSEAAGAGAHFQTHPLQRAVRDVNTISAHVVFDLDTRLEHHGCALLGQEVSGILV
jgi:3-hydroxy-9,10-secoandrosta-1,3,5(10)-triene-9,17-dione monooxygenase